MTRIGQLVLILAAGAFLAFASVRNESLRGLRREMNISQADPLENAPPLVAFTTVAMGGFRGIIADLLWLRAGRLQEEGKYFELVQLADWITKLEPRFTSVWAYQAWNLSYNISVLFDNADDRWRWVSNGMKLLRDQGLAYNPGEARLLYELGWIFQHKIGGNTDQMHMHYKRMWAAEMAALFDGPRPNFSDAELGRKLKDDYKLDVAVMENIDREYGPLDWRLPQAHALYWAYRSRLIARDFDAVSAERMIFQSMADALREGSLYLVPEENIFVPSPNLDLLPRVRAAFDDAIAKQPDQGTFKTAHQNFLTSAMVMLFTYNRVADARALYDELRERYPDAVGDASFESFVLKNFVQDVNDLSHRDALGIIEGALGQSLFWQAFGDSERAGGFASLAKLTWENYMAPRDDTAFAERTGLPPLWEIHNLALARMKDEFPQSAAINRLKDIRRPPAPGPANGPD